MGELTGAPFGGTSRDMDKPRAPRYQVGGMTFLYDTGEAFWSGQVLDASESGVFIETSHELPVGTRVTLMPHVPDDERLPFEVHAEVVRVNEYDAEANFRRPPGIAFRFSGLSPAQFGRLRSFLEERGVPVRGPAER